MSVLLLAAMAMRETAQEIMDFAASPRNNGPFSEEIYRSNIQIHGALLLLAERLEALSKGGVL
jgi:hypothetical protein